MKLLLKILLTAVGILILSVAIASLKANDSTSIHIAYGQMLEADAFYPSVKFPLYTIEKSNDTLFIWVDKTKHVEFKSYGTLGFVYQYLSDVKAIFYIGNEKIMIK
jgi:hypothetical protein